MADLYAEKNGRLVIRFTLTHEEAADLLAALQEMGIKPTPPEKPDPPRAPEPGPNGSPDKAC